MAVDQDALASYRPVSAARLRRIRRFHPPGEARGLANAWTASRGPRVRCS